MTDIVVTAALSVTDAADTHAALGEAVRAACAAGAPVTLDLDGPAPTQPALQLLIAAHRALDAAGLAVEPGPNARAIRIQEREDA